MKSLYKLTLGDGRVFYAVEKGYQEALKRVMDLVGNVRSIELLASLDVMDGSIETLLIPAEDGEDLKDLLETLEKDIKDYRAALRQIYSQLSQEFFDGDHRHAEILILCGSVLT